MTAEALIAQARENLGEPDISTVLEACEACYMNGCPDEVAGDVEGPEGHFYRVDRWIVATDSQGFNYLDEYDSAPAARFEFSKREERAYPEGDES